MGIGAALGLGRLGPSLWLNAGAIDPRGIAEFLVLDRRFPRSLHFCVDKLRSNLFHLAQEYGHETAAHEVMRGLGTRFHESTIQDVFDTGLHQFIQSFIATNQQGAQAIDSAITGLTHEAADRTAHP